MWKSVNSFLGSDTSYFESVETAKDMYQRCFPDEKPFGSLYREAVNEDGEQVLLDNEA